MSRFTRLFFMGLFVSSSVIVTGCTDSEQHNTPAKSETTQSEVKQQAAATENTATQNTVESEKPQSNATTEPASKTVKTATQSAPPANLPAIPNFKDFAAGSPRKQAFFEFMAPLIKQANTHILEKRQHLQSLMKKASLTKNDQAWLNQQANAYNLDDFDPTNTADLNALLTRIDAIPAALALAQGANESAWGTSRFARKANSYFGQWCFSKGCGLVPKQRNDGAIHEVRAFDHPYESVVSYIHNLNSHRTYQKLREIRAKTRQKGQTPTGLEMAEGLINYSARKHKYVKELQSMIRYNNLTQYN